MKGVAIATVAIAVPALVFTLWPLLRRGDRRTLLAFLPDAREQLTEQKRAVLRALREIDFEHGAGHISDDDYADLRARYEAEAADVLSELDRLGPVDVPEPVAPPAPARRSVWQHPAPLATAAVVVLAFGITLGAGIVRYTEPDTSANQPMPGSRPLATLDAPATPGGGQAALGTGPRDGPASGGGAGPTASGGRTIPPEMLRGMLQAARQALFSGELRDAKAAYEAVLKRDPKNVDALTHYALLAAMVARAHPDRAQEMTGTALAGFDHALAIDPDYAPALLYRGHVLYDTGDKSGAIAAWEKFLRIAPSGEDRDRVQKLLVEAKRETNPPAR